MNIFKTVLTATALLISLSGTASASTYHKYSSCGGGTDSTPSCDNLQQYNQDFTTTDFTKSSSSYNKYYFGFDALVKPADNFKITSASITIETTSNGMKDNLYAVNNGYWTAPAAISHAGSITYGIGSSLFDDILAGINFKAWFSLSSESISKAMLSVSGEYCLPASNVSAVPVPAAAFLFAPALIGFMGLRRKAKNTVA